VFAKASGVLNDKLHSGFPISAQQFERRITLPNPPLERICRREVKHICFFQEETSHRKATRASLREYGQNLRKTA